MKYKCHQCAIESDDGKLFAKLFDGDIICRECHKAIIVLAHWMIERRLDMTDLVKDGTIYIRHGTSEYN